MNIYCPMTMDAERLTQFTPEWDGERDKHGRPWVSDDVLRRMENVTITQAWGTCRGADYHYQYEGGFMCNKPGSTLVGRAMTAVYMPKRPDLRAAVDAAGKSFDNEGDLVSWPIEELVQDDVYVADVFGRIKDGPVIGENLATAIYSRTGKGVVHDAAVRDIDGINEIDGFVAYCRGVHPSHASPHTAVLAGVNCPVRIGETTVMPGDVVLAREDGVVFVPAHLALKTVESAELVTLRDVFGTQRIREGVYGPGAIDQAWTEAMESDFRDWIRAEAPRRGLDPAAVESLMQRMAGERTW